MTEAFRRESVLCASASGLHRMSYVEWGDPSNERVLICVHGLTRCARDFDALARALADRYRVVCPDMPGRGESDWLKNPMEYATPTYINSVVTLIARLGVGVGRLGRHLDGRADRDGVRLAGQDADPAHGAQRSRAGRHRPVAQPHRGVRRQGAAVPELRGRRPVRARGERVLRPAHRRRMALPDRALRPPPARRDVPRALRSEARRAVQRRRPAQGPRALAGVGEGEVPDARHPRRPVRSPHARHRRADEDHRPARRSGGTARHRPRADADARGPDRDRAGLSAARLRAPAAARPDPGGRRAPAGRRARGIPCAARADR